MAVKGLFGFPLLEVMDQTCIGGIHPDSAVPAATLRLNVPLDGEQQTYCVIHVHGREMHVDRACRQGQPVVGIHMYK
jgi:hypothetical protein